MLVGKSGVAPPKGPRRHPAHVHVLLPDLREARREAEGGGLLLLLLLIIIIIIIILMLMLILIILIILYNVIMILLLLLLLLLLILILLIIIIYRWMCRSSRPLTSASIAASASRLSHITTIL